jgi:hypothetical protein
MSISAARIREIEREFDETSGAVLKLKNLKPKSLKPTSEEGVNASVKSFGNGFVLLAHIREWGEHSFVNQRDAEKAVLFYLLRLKQIDPANLRPNGSCSWLYFGRRRGIYGAAIEEDTVGTFFLNQTELQQYRFFLYAHELGHFMLHRSSLIPQENDQGFCGWVRAKPAEDYMEEEANIVASAFFKLVGLTLPSQWNGALR